MAMPANLPGRPAHREEWDVYDRNNPNETFTRAPNAWHQACWQDEADSQDRFEDHDTPSERASNQGFGAPQERFLPSKEIRTEEWEAEFKWNLERDDDEIEDEDDER